MEIVDVLTVFAIVATNLITVITLHVQLDTKTTNILNGIQQEMKDFHGRLERIDAEFRGRLEKQDVEFRGRFEKQDAEFKAYLIHNMEGRR
jgi:hypothetical protein